MGVTGQFFLISLTKFLPTAAPAFHESSGIPAFVAIESLARGLPLRARHNEEEIILAVIRRSSEQRSDLCSLEATEMARLVGELSPNTDLRWLVERVCQTNLPWVVIPAAAIAAWEQRDPAGWEKVSEWLAVKGVIVVRV